MTIRTYVVDLHHTDYRKLVDAALSLEKEKTDMGRITDRARQMRARATNIAQQQQQGMKRTRDDVGLSGKCIIE